jgi:hypothetical protein
VGTAGKEDFGSGQLVHYLHLSELAKWPSHTATSQEHFFKAGEQEPAAVSINTW